MEYDKSNNQFKNNGHRKSTIISAGIILALFIVLIKIHNVNSITAHYEGNKLVYKGSYYKEHYGHYEASDKLIGYIKYPFDGIYSLENDNTHNYLYVTRFTDQYLFTKEGIEIPKSGDVSMVIINYHVDEAVTDSENINLILSLENQSGRAFYKGDIPKFSNNVPHYSTIYYCYNNCPVSEYEAGTLLYIRNEWIYFPKKHSDKGVVIADENIVKELNRIFSHVYKSYNE